MKRTEHLDLHMAELCRLRADIMAERLKRNGWEDLCGDVANVRGLSPLFERHASHEEIREYIDNMDTACREELPQDVREEFTRQQMKIANHLHNPIIRCTLRYDYESVCKG